MKRMNESEGLFPSSSYMNVSNSRTPLKEIPQSVLNQEINVLRTPIQKNTPSKPRYQSPEPIKSHFTSKIREIDNKRQLGACKMIIQKQNLEIKRLKQQLAFFKLSSVLQRRNHGILKISKAINDPDGKFATPKKRKITEENVLHPQEPLIPPTYQHDYSSPLRFPSPQKKDSQFPTHLYSKPPLPSHQGTGPPPPPPPPPTAKQPKSPPPINFRELNSLLDGIESGHDDSDNYESQKQEKLKNIHASLLHQRYVSHNNKIKAHTSPPIQHSPVYESENSSPLSERSPYSLAKKNVFLTNITKQYGPVSMSELPAYKEKITSWKNKYS